ncbi:PilZ domain-containing protein [Paenibacillus alkalitolerans]|uniref:PilZ domain-containing protein n=1 Tax=Paenibacillus alkalitolerans TaxID=2799335 RepID=UPI0018F4AF96|nr:PilZ domain-containing protein [Paenibacillus alkalitolerans]
MALLRNEDISHHHKNSVAIGSRVSVERKDFVSTGIVTFIEGDIIEIELSQAKYYKPGDEVKVTVYSSNGFLILPSSVIAIDIDVIMILNPPENQRLIQRRSHPRIDLQSGGIIHSLGWAGGSGQKLNEPLPIHISNISIGGIGFIVADETPLRAAMIAEAELAIIGGLRCKIEISRKQAAERGAYVGAKFLDVPAEQQTSLRGFIIRTQIEARAKQRREEAAL